MFNIKLVASILFLTIFPQIADGREVMKIESEDVVIAPNAIVMPKNAILIIRKESLYCAVKFLEFSEKNDGESKYAIYESYFQNDKTGNFLNKNVKYNKDELSNPKPRGIGRLAFSFGNKNIKCGCLKLEWTGKGSVYFYRSSQTEGDYGIELAPTKWTAINQVNVFDPRLKWYKFDENRERIAVPLEKLW